MQLANIKPDVVTYTGLIKVYAKARRVEEAQELFREMVASGVRCALEISGLVVLCSRCKTLFDHPSMPSICRTRAAHQLNL